MTSVTWNSTASILIEDRPNFAVPYEVGASVSTITTRSISGIEERRSLGDTLQFSVRCTIALEGSDQIAAWRNAQQAMSVEPILLPLWVAKRAPGASHPVSANVWLVTQPGSAPAMYDTASIPGGLPATAWIVPIMVGYLTQWPDMQHVTSELAMVDVSFSENSNTDFLTLSAYTPPAGITVAGITPSLFPWRPNHATVPRGQGAQVTIDRTKIGEGRATSDTYFSQLSVRPEFRAFTFADDEPWQFFRYFLDSRAGKASMWLPGTMAETRLTADVSSGHTTLVVQVANNIGSNSFLVLDDRTNRAPVKVLNKSGTNINLTASVGTAFNADQTQLFPLQLSRIASGNVTLKFEHDTLASTELRFVEVPWETVSPGGETIGSTFGALPDSAYLYAFTINIPGNVQTFYYTDYRGSVTYSGNTYVPKPIEHGDIRIALGLDRQTVQIKSRTFTNNPLNQILPFSLEYPLMLSIYEVDVVSGAAANAVRHFYGEVTGCRSVGPVLTATAKSFGSVLDRKIPRALIQPTCNHTVYDTGCGLSKASFQYDALIVSWTPATSVLVVGTITKATVAQTGLAAHLFANGIIEVGTGAARQQRWIGDNLVQSGSNLSITLASPLSGTWSAGTAVKFYPGCDGRYSTCTSKFSNGVKFGGFPFMPIGNPSLIRISKNLSVGGKK